MDQKEIAKFERQMGIGKTIKLKNTEGVEDEFYFEPLGVDMLPKFMKLAAVAGLNNEEKDRVSKLKRQYQLRTLSKEDYENQIKDLEETAGMRIMEGENGILLVDLLEQMVLNSYPDLEDKILKKFIYNNVVALQSLLMDLNEGIMGSNEEVMSKVEEMRQRVHKR